MSLMLKLLTTTLLASSLVSASSTSVKVEKYLDNEFGDNPRLQSLTVKVEDVKPLTDVKGWDAYIVNIEASLKSKPKEKINQKMIWFSNGSVITKELTNLKNGESYVNSVKPSINKNQYTKENLVLGNPNAKHKVAIFSDPLCPFCKDFAPAALAYMKKYPNKFAVYYFHYPILRIHPASAIITRAAVVAERKGIKDVTLKMYNIKIGAREKDVQKILAAFNKVVGSNVTEKEVKDPSVSKQINHDAQIARDLFVNGTPTIYFDDKFDSTRVKYKTAK